MTEIDHINYHVHIRQSRNFESAKWWLQTRYSLHFPAKTNLVLATATMATVAVSTAAAAATESSGSASSTGTSVVAVPTVSGTTPVAAGASKLGSRIVYSAAGVEIVCRPYLVCEELEKLSQESSQDFIASLDHSKIVNPVSVEILNG